MLTRTSWLDLVPVCRDVYVYQTSLLCADCADETFARLQKTTVVRDDDSDDLPHGPYSDGGGEADSPRHCDSAEDCVNAVRVPNGRRVGCPLGNPLTKYGERYVVASIARDVFGNTPHARAVGRLWLHVYDYLRPEELIELQAVDPRTSPTSKLLPKQYRPVPQSSPYTDLRYLYGAAVSTTQPEVALWRLTIDDVGKFSEMSTIHLPNRELAERTVEDLLEEAWRDDAWEQT
jgi:hypothetical protein